MNHVLQSRSRGESPSTTLSPVTVGEVTQLLAHWDAKNAYDQSRLLDLVYPELKRIAEFRMRHERPEHTLQATALVSEFVLQLCSAAPQTWESRSHFLAVASRAMRRILVDHARAVKAGKRGGGEGNLRLSGLEVAQARPFHDILEIHDLLEKLAAEDARMADLVEMRYFGGLSNGEIAETLGVAERTVKRDWQVARARLYAQLHVKGKGDAGG